MEGREAEDIAYFVEQASSRRGAELTTVVVEATSHPGVFAFSEILAVPRILELEGTENSYYLDLLRMFAYGTWNKYKDAASRLPELVPDQVLKLKQLTMLTLAEKTKILPYDTLMEELEISNARELEDFLITNCIYAGLVTGKLNHMQRRFEVQFALARDIRPGELRNLIQMVEKRLSTSANILVSIEKNIRWAEFMHEIEVDHQVELSRIVEDVKKALVLENEAQVVPKLGRELDIGEIPRWPKRRRSD